MATESTTDAEIDQNSSAEQQLAQILAMWLGVLVSIITILN